MFAAVLYRYSGEAAVHDDVLPGHEGGGAGRGQPDDRACEFVRLASGDIDQRLKSGPDLVSANFVIPYPPGFPIMVPGQVITADTITFMRKLDVKEIHGYNAGQGLKLLKPAALAALAAKARR